MAPNAQDAFKAWLLKMEIIGGSACLLIFVIVLAGTVVLVINFRKKRE